MYTHTYTYNIICIIYIYIYAHTCYTYIYIYIYICVHVSSLSLCRNLMRLTPYFSQRRCFVRCASGSIALVIRTAAKTWRAHTHTILKISCMRAQLARALSQAGQAPKPQSTCGMMSLTRPKNNIINQHENGIINIH